jgi:hypothetical protein
VPNTTCNENFIFFRAGIFVYLEAVVVLPLPLVEGSGGPFKTADCGVGSGGPCNAADCGISHTICGLLVEGPMIAAGCGVGSGGLCNAADCGVGRSIVGLLVKGTGSSGVMVAVGAACCH